VKWSLEQKIPAGFTLTLVFLLGIGAIAYRSETRSIETYKWVDHTHEVLRQLERISVALLDAETDSRGFALSGNESFLKLCQAAQARLKEGIADLRRQIQDNPQELQKLKRLEELAIRKLSWIAVVIDTRKNAGLAGAVEKVSTGEGAETTSEIRQVIGEMESVEQKLLIQRSSKAQAEARSTIAAVALTSAIGILAAGTAGWVVRRDFLKRAETEKNIRTLNAELEKRSSQLVDANAEMQAFSYSVSHDLRSPLRAITGYTASLQETSGERLDTQGKSDLNRVRAACRRMGQIIDDLLALARVSQTEMNRTRINISELAQSVLAELQKGQPERRIEARIEPGLVADADANLIRIALENLIANAWKFTKNVSNPSIEIGCVRNDGTTAYYVRDNGAGFDMAYANKLFRPFQRLHDRNEFEGTGIGLATVERIIHRHGGRVWAEGAPSRGATFHFTLPAVADEPLSKKAA